MRNWTTRTMATAEFTPFGTESSWGWCGGNPVFLGGYVVAGCIPDLCFTFLEITPSVSYSRNLSFVNNARKYCSTGKAHISLCVWIQLMWKCQGIQFYVFVVGYGTLWPTNAFLTWLSKQWTQFKNATANALHLQWTFVQLIKPICTIIIWKILNHFYSISTQLSLCKACLSSAKSLAGRLSSTDPKMKHLNQEEGQETAYVG